MFLYRLAPFRPGFLKAATVTLRNNKLFIIRYCPSLVLTTVPGRARQADAKHSVKNYQGPTTSRENAIQKYLNFPHTFFYFNFCVIMA